MQKQECKYHRALGDELRQQDRSGRYLLLNPVKDCFWSTASVLLEIRDGHKDHFLVRRQVLGLDRVI